MNVSTLKLLTCDIFKQIIYISVMRISSSLLVKLESKNANYFRVAHCIHIVVSRLPHYATNYCKV